MLDADTVIALSCGWIDAEHASAVCGLSSEQRRSGYIYAMDPTGQRAWRPDSDERWAKTRLAAGLSASVRLHHLRHFQATQLLDAGVPVPTVAARLGNADGTTTMKIYAHRTQRAQTSKRQTSSASCSATPADSSARKRLGANSPKPTDDRARTPTSRSPT